MSTSTATYFSVGQVTCDLPDLMGSYQIVISNDGATYSETIATVLTVDARCYVCNCDDGICTQQVS